MVIIARTAKCRDVDEKVRDADGLSAETIASSLHMPHKGHLNFVMNMMMMIIIIMSRCIEGFNDVCVLKKLKLRSLLLKGKQWERSTNTTNLVTLYLPSD